MAVMSGILKLSNCTATILHADSEGAPRFVGMMRYWVRFPSRSVVRKVLLLDDILIVIEI